MTKQGLPALFSQTLAQIENPDDVGLVIDASTPHRFLERFKCRRVGNIANGLEGNVSLDDGIVGALHHSHAALPENFLDLVTTLQLRLGCHEQ